MKAKILGWTNWIILNAIALYIIYVALFEQKEWAKNVVVFFSHLIPFYMLLIVVGIERGKITKEHYIKKKIVPVKYDMYYDLIVMTGLVAFGWFYTAILWLFQILFEITIFTPDEKKEEPKQG